VSANAIRSAETKRAAWKIGDVAATSDARGRGRLSATFDLVPGRVVTSLPMAAFQFSSELTTLSGVDFELAGPGFRVSLVKKRIASGLSQLCATYGRLNYWPVHVHTIDLSHAL